MWARVLFVVWTILPINGFPIDNCGVFGKCEECVTFPHCTWIVTKSIVGICVDKQRVPFLPTILTFKDDTNCGLFAEIKGKLQKAYDDRPRAETTQVPMVDGNENATFLNPTELETVSHGTKNETTDDKPAIPSHSIIPPSVQHETVTQSSTSSSVDNKTFMDSGTVPLIVQAKLETEKQVLNASHTVDTSTAENETESQIQNDGNIVEYSASRRLKEPLVQKMKRASCNAYKYLIRLRKTALPSFWMGWNDLNPMRNRANECQKLYRKRKNYYSSKQ